MANYIEMLADEVNHDVMACIGCNDCLLACPLPESRNVTIAELNHSVTAEEITSQNIIDFVTRCTQCQQCVPVCPADLRRADIVLWNKLKVEGAAPDRTIPLQSGERISDSSWTADALSEHLTQLPLFSGVSALSLRRVLLSVTLRSLGIGEVLVDEGDYNERLFVVLEGSLEQSAMEANGQRTRILVLGPGSFHGYMAVMSNSREPFTISAVSDSTILEFNKATVIRLMNESSAFKETLDTLYYNAAVWTQAKRSPLLASLPEDQIDELLETSVLRSVPAGEVLYREGERPEFIYLVRSGFLRVARTFGRDERVLQYFRDGDVAGVSAVLFDRAHSATVSANTRSEVLAIPANEIREMLTERPDVRDELMQEASRSEQFLNAVMPPVETKANPTENLISTEGLLDEGVIQGHKVLAINTAICTSCNNCVDACERRHGYSRLDRRGLQLGDLLFPSACRHCEDPKCLLCSVSGIVREPNGEIRIVTDNCVGCGACAERCPYGNIQMHLLEEKTQGPISRLLSIFTGGPDDELHDTKGHRVAVKCDLCAGFDDYACVRNCPVGAAMRIDPVEVFGRSDVLIGIAGKTGVSPGSGKL